MGIIYFYLLDYCLEIEHKTIKTAGMNRVLQALFSTPADCETGTDTDNLLKAVAKIHH